MFGFNKSIYSQSDKSSKDPKSKEYYKANSLSGQFRSFDPKTGKLKQEGRFQKGKEVGIWKEFDQDGDQIHYQFTMQRVGALCGDGTTSTATGRGACSWHGGVAEWLYDSVKYRVGGTGKYLPPEKRLQSLRQQVKIAFKIKKSGNQFQQEILKLVLSLNKKNLQLETQFKKANNKIEENKIQISQANKKIQDLTTELKDMKKKERIEVIKANENLKQKNKLQNKKVIITDFSEEQEKPKAKTGGQKVEEKKSELKPKTDKKQLENKKDESQKIWNKEILDKSQSKIKVDKPKENEILQSELGSDSDWQVQQENVQSNNNEDQSSKSDTNDSRLIKQLMDRLRLT